MTRDRKDPPAPEENRNCDESAHDRSKRKHHESENQDEALRKPFLPVIRCRRLYRPRRPISQFSDGLNRLAAIPGHDRLGHAIGQGQAHRQLRIAGISQRMLQGLGRRTVAQLLQALQAGLGPAV